MNRRAAKLIFDLAMKKEKEKNMEKLTYGEKAVGLDFNPSGSIDVLKVKGHIADLINTLYIKRGKSDNPEVQRMLSIAITDLQTAQMWAVKALTWKY